MSVRDRRSLAGQTIICSPPYASILKEIVSIFTCQALLTGDEGRERC